MDIHDRGHVLHDLPDPPADIAGAYRNRNADQRLRQFYAGPARQRSRYAAYFVCCFSRFLFAHREAVHESEVAFPGWKLDCWSSCSDEIRVGRVEGTVAKAGKPEIFGPTSEGVLDHRRIRALGETR